MVLVHYELLEKRREEPDHNMTMDRGMSSRARSGGKSEVRTSSQVRGYVIARSPDGLEILARYDHKSCSMSRVET